MSERSASGGSLKGVRAGGLPSDPGGVILADKPAGVTSHDVVAAVRRRLGRGVRVGHAGTLDPFATGLLLVLVGRATRVQRWLMELPKRYEVVARFGFTSTTGDPEGEIVSTGVVPSGDLVLPTGTVRQRPPAYSAVKVGGRRAYQLARAGEAVELAEREVSVYTFEEVSREADRRAFAIECSSGTYVRSLIMDLGDAYCESLRRTRIGSFDVAEAGDSLVPLGEALSFMPGVSLPGDDAVAVSHGRTVSVSLPGEGSAFRLLDPDGDLVAIGAPGQEPGTVRPVVGFRG